MVRRIHRNCFQARKTIDSQWVREERNLACELMQQNSAIELELSNGTRQSDGHLFNFTVPFSGLLFVDCFWNNRLLDQKPMHSKCDWSRDPSGGNLKGNP